ncbi:hypothetical protein L6164_027478 [Bauhinia variegata]|uniref:Uncharacterized protein n=1 Tax=Bauhinia variegata TaxID=167791 RepID=A0ACB9LUZ0_BAUVA|nr:hypothetical protein L6164_027478 [Bauhinia variegata]
MACAKSHSPSHALFLVAILLPFLTFWPKRANASGFTVDLIARDSPLSPFYNSSKTHCRLRDAFRRSLSRANRFNSAILTPTSKIQTELIPDGGEYIMNISIGTPPMEVLAIADTGSDLVWIQCLPCKDCYKQTLPLFNPGRSSSHQTVRCESSFCNALPSSTCQQNTCEYSYSYGDSSYTNGDLATETLTLGINTPVSFPRIVFGCGHDNGGTFDKQGSGLVGLGGGKLSLISQLGQSISQKFSYCLVPTEAGVSGKISFGTDAITSGTGAVTTPLIRKNVDTFYFLTLEAISVGNQRIAYKGSSKVTPDAYEGNIIIDSGTTLTLLTSQFIDDLISALKKNIKATTVKDPKGDYSLCYKKVDFDHSSFPVITAHFRGADVKLQPLNTFALVEDDVVCFTMIASSGVSIYGNLAQVNFNVGYDLEARTVSFLPRDCTKQR